MRITRIIKGFIATAFSVFFLFVGYATKSYIDKDLSTRRYTNPTKHLNIETYDGGGEALHPKCLYFRENWEGFNFWMVLTPYKGMNEAIENPCIYTSDNGINFTPVLSAYPLDSITLSCKEEYNSDPHLVFNSELNRLECWWRRVYTNNYPLIEKRCSELLYRSYSNDGQTWVKKELIFEYKNQTTETRGIISPVILYENGIYHIWASCSEDASGTIRYIDYYQYKNNEEINKISRIVLEDCTPSHFDIVKKDTMYYLCVQDVGIKGFPYKLYISHEPEFHSFKYCGIVLMPGKSPSWDSDRLYRPSLTIINDQWNLYYSAYYGIESHIGLIKFQEWCEIAPTINIVNKKQSRSIIQHFISDLRQLATRESLQ